MRSEKGRKKSRKYISVILLTVYNERQKTHDDFKVKENKDKSNLVSISYFVWETDATEN